MKSNTQHQKKQSTHVCIWTHGSNKLQFLFQKHVPAVVAATAFWMESCWRSLGETCALGVLKLSFCLCLVFFWHKFHELERQKKLWTRKHHTLSYHHHILHTCCFPPRHTTSDTQLYLPQDGPAQAVCWRAAMTDRWAAVLEPVPAVCAAATPPAESSQETWATIFLCLYNVTKCRRYGLVATGLTLEKNAGMLCHLLCGTRQRVEATVATSTQGGTTTKTTQNWRCRPNLTSSALTGSKCASTYRKCNPNWTSSTLTGSKCKRTTRNTTRTQPNWMPFKPNRMCRWGSHHDPNRSCKWRGTNSRSASNCSSSAQRWQKNTLALARVMGQEIFWLMALNC